MPFPLEDFVLGWPRAVAAEQGAGERDPGDFAQGKLFSWPKSVDPQAVKRKLAPEALAMLTAGVDLRGARLRPWSERESVGSQLEIS